MVLCVFKNLIYLEGVDQIVNFQGSILKMPKFEALGICYQTRSHLGGPPTFGTKRGRVLYKCGTPYVLLHSAKKLKNLSKIT